jgi:hypothetical protein
MSQPSPRSILGTAAFAALAAALVACSGGESERQDNPAPVAQAAKPEAAAKPGGARSGAKHRIVRTGGTVETVTASQVGFRLDDGSSLVAERALLQVPQSRTARREARRTGAKTAPLPTLEIGRHYPLAVRYGPDGKLAEVRIRRAPDAGG